jgi:hypothetical protein
VNNFWRNGFFGVLSFEFFENGCDTLESEEFELRKRKAKDGEKNTLF